MLECKRGWLDRAERRLEVWVMRGGEMWVKGRRERRVDMYCLGQLEALQSGICLDNHCPRGAVSS